MTDMQDRLPLRIVFAGTPEFAAAHLQALLGSQHQILAVYTQPDRPAGRGKQLTAGPVKQLAAQHAIPVHQPLSLRDPTEIEQLRELKPDLMLVVAYGQILPQVVLDIPRLGCVNVHASLLPRWRGAAPIQRAIEAGDTNTGVTIMQMEAGLDTGPSLLQAACAISNADTSASLHDRLATIGATTLLSALEQIASGSLVATPQDDDQATYAAKLTKQEADLDWSLSAIALSRKVRAFVPFPVAYTALNNERVRIYAANVCEHQHTAKPSEILEVGHKGVVVQCGTQALCLTQLQLPNKRVMSVQEILNGQPDLFEVGDHFSREGS